MERWRKLLLCTAACAGLLAVSSASAAIMLDCGTATSPVMAGWTKLTNTNAYSGSGATPVDLGGGVTAGFDGTYLAGSTDRTQIVGSPLQTLGLDDLVRDFVSFPTSRVLQIKGLAAGDYSVTVYAVDPAYLAEGARIVYVNGTKVTIGPTSSSPTLATVSTTLTTTVSSTGVLTFSHGPEGNPFKINGIVVTPVPEPFSMLLVLAGIGAGMIRRR